MAIIIGSGLLDRTVCPPSVKLVDIYRGGVALIVIKLLALLLVIIFPVLALWLPSIAYK